MVYGRFFLFFSLALASFLYADSQGQVSIDIVGRIPKSVAVKVTQNFSSLNLEKIYSRKNGKLKASNFTLSKMAAISNSSEGYKIAVETAHSFQLRNSTGESIPYTLSLSSQNGSSAQLILQHADTGNAVLAQVMPNTKENLKEETFVLKMHTEEKGNFLIKDENFTDVLKLRAIAQ